MSSKNLIVKTVLLFLLGIYPSFELLAQPPTFFNLQFDLNNHAEVAYNVIQTDSGYIVCGISASAVTQYDIEFMSIDSAGNVLFRKTYGRPNTFYYPGWGGSLIKTSDGGFALAGNIVDTGFGVALLIKFNNVGDTLWTKTFGGDSIYAAYQCKQTTDGGFIISGFTDAYDYWGDVLLIKTDNVGNELWRNTYGGNNSEYGVTVDPTSDGGFLIGGSTQSFGGDVDQYVIKTDSNGILQWQKALGGIYDDAYGIACQLSDGNYLIGGTWTFAQQGGPGQGNPHGKPYLTKLDTLGNVIWSRTYGSVNFNTTITSLLELNDGTIVACGYTSLGLGMEGLIIKADAQGDSLWYRTYTYTQGNEDYLFNIHSTSDNGFIASGYTRDNNQNGWLLKLDSLGCDTTGCTPMGIALNIAPSHAMNVFPVPCSGILNIKFEDEFPTHIISVIDITGRIVIPEEITIGREIQLNVSSLSSGVYIVNVIEGKGRGSYRKQIVVE